MFVGFVFKLGFCKIIVSLYNFGSFKVTKTAFDKMNLNQRYISPSSSLVTLIGFLLLFSLLSQLLVFCIVFLFSLIGISLVDFGDMVSNPSGSSLWYIYMMIGLTTVGSFVVPVLFLRRMEEYTFEYFPTSKQNQGLYFLLTILLLFCVNPIMGLISDWNSQMSLPAYFSDVEQWIRTKEDEMQEVTKHLVMVDSLARLLVNIFFIGFLPAFCEELFFRGALQSIVQRWFSNPHLPIWISAIVFSALHLQFYGFLPRMFLGAIFGYLLVWTNNIWVPIFAHFLNNTSMVIISYVFAIQEKSYQELTKSTNYSSVVYLLSLFATIGLSLYFYKRSKKIKGDKLWKAAG